jgi:hypothetical protein
LNESPHSQEESVLAGKEISQHTAYYEQSKKYVLMSIAKGNEFGNKLYNKSNSAHGGHTKED